MRIVAVLGFSVRRSRDLQPVCAARVAAAIAIARDDDVVVLSGWARTPGAASEAELMRSAWTGTCARLILDDGATHTADNARRVVAIARSLNADEIVVVTSRWHATRAAIAFRMLLRGTGIRVSLARAHGPLGLWGLAREAAAWPAFSILLARSRRRA